MGRSTQGQGHVLAQVALLSMSSLPACSISSHLASKCCFTERFWTKILDQDQGMRSSQKRPLQDVGSRSPYLRNGKLAQIHFLASW